MTDGEPDWTLYRTFLAVVRAGNFTSAAQALGATQPTIGRQIEALESLLGMKLFARSPRGLQPTTEAMQLVPYAEQMAATAAALIRASSGDLEADVGIVRLTTGEYVGVEILPPMLAEFAAAHPGIELELSLSNRNEDILQRDADIAVRMLRPTQKALIARRVGSVAVGLYAHRSYVEARGLPLSPAEITHHRLIGFDRDFHVLQTTGGRAAQLRREDFGLRTDNVAAQIAALRAGMGIAACHVAIAQREPNLVPVLADVFIFEREIWLVMHPDLKDVQRIRLLFDHLANRLTAYAKGGASQRIGMYAHDESASKDVGLKD
jgi:DNA-binding transcriptional LysR family regulator